MTGKKHSITQLIILILILAGVAAFGGYYFYQRNQTSAPLNLQAATILPQPQALIDFSLTDNHNKIFTKANLTGHWSLIFFGFTHCGYICPTTMNELKLAYNNIVRAHAIKPQVILISIDPERDTVTQINRYVTAYNSNFIGLTGSEKQIEALADNLKILYVKIKSKKSNINDDIDHSGTIMLINPNAQLAAIFTMPHQADKIAADYEAITKRLSI